MTKEEGSKAGIDDPRSFFRSETGKANLAPLDKADWFKLVSVSLGNGDDGPFDNSDHVAVAETWKWPDAFADVDVADLKAVQKAIGEGEWRADSQSKAWAGKAVADVLGLDLTDPAVKTKVKILLGTWTKNGMLREVSRKDAKSTERKFLTVGDIA